MNLTVEPAKECTLCTTMLRLFQARRFSPASYAPDCPMDIVHVTSFTGRSAKFRIKCVLMSSFLRIGTLERARNFGEIELFIKPKKSRRKARENLRAERSRKSTKFVVSTCEVRKWALKRRERKKREIKKEKKIRRAQRMLRSELDLDQTESLVYRRHS